MGNVIASYNLNPPDSRQQGIENHPQARTRSQPSCERRPTLSNPNVQPTSTLPSKHEPISEIKKAVPNGNVSFLQLDLSSFESVKKAAEEFKGKSDRLDILVNNAGIMATPYSKTNEGYEIQFGTNHMGHALFTKLLLPTLLKTAETPGADVRVVNLSSEGHNMAPNGGILFDQAALEKVGPWARYGQAKLANILHARELQKHHPSLTATALHPGVIVTDLYNPFSSTTFGGGAFK